MENKFYKNKLYLIAFLLLFFAINIYAIQISITPDKNVSNIKIGSMDKQALKSYLKDTIGFVITEKGAKKVAKENRILANVYLKRYPLDTFTKHRIKIMIEDYLAKKMVDKVQKQIAISPKVIQSYYYDHLQDFKKPATVDLVGFDFPSYESAVDFYYKIRNKDIEFAKKLAKQKNITIASYRHKKIKDLAPSIQKILKKDKEKYFLPPLIIGDHIKILYVSSYHKAKGYIPLKKVEGKIKKYLYDKTFFQYRKKILEEYENNHDE